MLSLRTLLSTLTLCLLAVNANAQPDLSGFGENFSLNGENSTILPDTGQLHVWQDVIVTTDLYRIECDDLVAALEEKTLVATGGPINLTMGEMEATCGHLFYNTETGGIELSAGESGDKPHIIQRDEEGKVIHFRANVITMSEDENGDTVFDLNGAVEIDSESPGEQTSAAVVVPSISIPAMGDSGSLWCDTLRYHTGQGLLVAEGLVEIISEDLTLACEWLNYLGSTGQLRATGDQVNVAKSEVTATCTELHYTPETGLLVLDRLAESDPQPEVWHTREEGIFHAIADQITVTEREDGEPRVTCSQRYVIENLPLDASAVPEAGHSEEPRRLESLDLLPGTPLEPRA